MNFVESIKMAFSSLAINKLRSFLTMLGIIIGISAVITITTIGNSIQKTLSNTFNKLGAVKLQIYVDRDPEYDGPWEDLTKSDMITRKMIQDLINEHPEELTYSINDIFGKSEIQNVDGEVFSANLYGVSDDYFDSFKKQIIKGRALSKSDCNNAKYTCLVSDVFVGQYFGDPDYDAIGETIKFEMNDGNNIYLTIVGIMEYTDLEKNQLGFNKAKNELEKKTMVFLPYNAMLKFEGLAPEETYVDTAEIGWTAKCDSETAKSYIQKFFKRYYGNNEKWDIEIYDPVEELGMINTVLNVITIAISVIAAISLIVGGVGVMNIMLVSILERTREIGVRKALGALNEDIRSQFVIEAIIICLTGGTIGVIVGIVNGVLISKIASVLLNTMASEYAEYITLTVSPSIPAIIISLGFAMLTGLIFGYYPAKRAGNMNPIDALRYE
ncbi:MAG: ABC transporter permease [Ruminococcus sp.]|nr:ABC transporter permease [Ruminococcus sp.]